MMVNFLVGLVSMILMRTLRKDYARYSKDEDIDDMARHIFLNEKKGSLERFYFRKGIWAMNMVGNRFMEMFFDRHRILYCFQL